MKTYYLATILLASIIFLGCKKEDKSQPPSSSSASIEGDWWWNRWDVVNYQNGDSISAATYNQPNVSSYHHHFSNNIVLGGGANGSQVGTYTTSTVTLQSITYTITHLSTNNMVIREYPNGINNGAGNVLYYTRL